MTLYEANMTIDCLKEMQEGYIEGEGYERHPLPEWYALDKAIEAIEQTKWIPCSEGLPKVSDYYLIQHSRSICPDEMAVAFYSVEEAELDENYTWEFKPFADCKEVIAWMPLPEAYTGGKE